MASQRGPAARPRILVLARYYLPAYLAGGPVRTIANMVDRLHADLDFWIITSDRDLGISSPYPDVPIDAWTRVGGAMVYYASPEALRGWGLQNVIRSTTHDVLYLNSLFDPVFTALPLVLRRAGQLPSKPTVIAPRGELAGSALRLKPWQKRAYRMVAEASGLFRGLTWQASSDFEASDIRREMGSSAADVHIAPDVPPSPRKVPTGEVEVARHPKGPLLVCFVGRIAPIKNLHVALQVLARLDHPVLFRIYGPIEDPGYWRSCQSLIEGFRGPVSVEY